MLYGKKDLNVKYTIYGGGEKMNVRFDSIM
jgi:hypothetical protein